jgi:hypothetical protein
MTQPWQKRRSQFNHDWLKNQYMPALAKNLNLLDDLIEDDEFAQSFVSHVLPAWEKHRGEAIDLAGTFESEMSPRALFASSPLCNCTEETKGWLGSLVHMLWLKRYPISEWVAEAAQAVEQTDAAYQRLREAFQDNHSFAGGEPSPKSKEQFVEFRRNCQLMANAISKFPGDVNVL